MDIITFSSSRKSITNFNGFNRGRSRRISTQLKQSVMQVVCQRKLHYDEMYKTNRGTYTSKEI
jgi:hypothetical protein